MKAQARYIYQAVVPKPVRKRIRKVPGLERIIRSWVNKDTQFHDEYWTAESFKRQNKWLDRSGPIIAGDMMEMFSPKSAVDVGCGQGSYMEPFHKAGVEVHGIDLAEAGLQISQSKGLDVRKQDLTKDPVLPWRADLVYSIEVAEHLPEAYADLFVQAISEATKSYAVITAAGPGQEGLNHFNCQPKQYWIDRFVKQGFEYESERTEDWEHRNQERDMPMWFCHNLIVLRRVQKA